MKKKSYFKLFLAFLLYLFSCIRIFFVGGEKRQSVFFISAKNLFSSFLYNFDVLSENLKSNMMMMMIIMFLVTVSACCLCCLNDGCIPFSPTHSRSAYPPHATPTTPNLPTNLTTTLSTRPSSDVLFSRSSANQSSPVQSIKQCFLC